MPPLLSWGRFIKSISYVFSVANLLYAFILLSTEKAARIFIRSVYRKGMRMPSFFQTSLHQLFRRIQAMQSQAQVPIFSALASVTLRFLVAKPVLTRSLDKV
jgi:hypothetical protein